MYTLPVPVQFHNLSQARLIRTWLIQVPLYSQFLWNLCQITIISWFKCIFNLNMVNLKFHYIEVNLTGV